VRLASCSLGDRRFAALVEDDAVRPLRDIVELGPETPWELLSDPPLADERLALADVQLLPVIPHPGKIVCMGLNYRAHAEEGGYEVPDYPALFAKFNETLVAAGDPILLPPESSAVDFEAELAFVIGRTVRRASGPAALEAVAGYTVANDITMRDYQYKTPQWLPGKNWATSTPLGPFLVTPDEVGDPHDLDISLELNGEQMQSANTSQLIFDVPALIATISEFVPLAPGDVVLTGTPSGVGYRRDPKVLLRDGDRVVVEVERVGRLENPVAAEPVGRDVPGPRATSAPARPSA
jgi:acylpyruvate hydrolase